MATRCCLSSDIQLPMRASSAITCVTAFGHKTFGMISRKEMRDGDILRHILPCKLLCFRVTSGGKGLIPAKDPFIVAPSDVRFVAPVQRAAILGNVLACSMGQILRLNSRTCALCC